MPIGSMRSPGGVTSTTGPERSLRSYCARSYCARDDVTGRGVAVLNAGTCAAAGRGDQEAHPTGSDVQEPDVLGVALDERATTLHVLAHQHAEQLVGDGGVVQGDAQQDAPLRVHRGV